MLVESRGWLLDSAWCERPTDTLFRVLWLTEDTSYRLKSAYHACLVAIIEFFSFAGYSTWHLRKWFYNYICVSTHKIGNRKWNHLTDNRECLVSDYSFSESTCPSMILLFNLSNYNWTTTYQDCSPRPCLSTIAVHSKVGQKYVKIFWTVFRWRLVRTQCWMTL
jgi:hypothetical protein